MPMLKKPLFFTKSGFQAGPYFPNFPYFLTAALIFLIKVAEYDADNHQDIF
jgi:hypothetical protein